MARPMGKMTALMENVIRAEARGEPWPEIYEKYTTSSTVAAALKFYKDR